MTIELHDTRREVQAPPAFAEHSCALVPYRQPGLPHCFSPCRELHDGAHAPVASTLAER